MRRLVAVLALAVAAIVVVDLAAPAFIGLEPGSVGIEPQTADLELLPFDSDWDDPECMEPDWTDEEPCPRRYDFAAGATLTVWFAVRNAGSMPIRLLGVSNDWIDQFRDTIPLARPVAGVDGGDPHRPGTLAELVARPFDPVTLAPDDERLIGLEFVVTDDVAGACEHWQGGGGIEWGHVPLSWSLVVFEHDQELPLMTPVSFMAPTAEDCG